jgi:hypothetical protein
MNWPSLHFSLRNLFTATTLIAIFFSTVSVHPAVLIASLVLLSPVLFVVAMATCANHPLAAKRIFFGSVGFVLVLFGGKVAIGASQPESWILAGILVAFGAAFWAWMQRAS